MFIWSIHGKKNLIDLNHQGSGGGEKRFFFQRGSESPLTRKMKNLVAKINKRRI